MSRRNLQGTFGESRIVSVRLSDRDIRAAQRLQKAWGAGLSETLRRALQEAVRRLDSTDKSARR